MGATEKQKYMMSMFATQASEVVGGENSNVARPRVLRGRIPVFSRAPYRKNVIDATQTGSEPWLILTRAPVASTKSRQNTIRNHFESNS